MIYAAKEMRGLWEEEAASHAAELEGAAEMVKEWASELMTPNAELCGERSESERAPGYAGED
jgi:hypothetical protein